MADENYTIRSARPDDADAAAEMWAEMTREHAANGRQGWNLADDAVSKWQSHFLERLQKEDCFALVAVDATGRTVGFVTARMKDPEPLFVSGRGSDITNLSVKSERRRRGIGRRLIEAALKTAKSRGAQYITLGVACANEAAIELYKDLGFRDVMRQMHKDL